MGRVVLKPITEALRVAITFTFMKAGEKLPGTSGARNSPGLLITAQAWQLSVKLAFPQHTVTTSLNPDLLQVLVGTTNIPQTEPTAPWEGHPEVDPTTGH